jgi:hypothetical protein
MTREEFEVLHARKIELEKLMNACSNILELLNHSMSAENKQYWKVKYSKAMSEHIELERKGA